MTQLVELVRLFGSKPKLCTCSNTAGKHSKALLKYIRTTATPTDQDAAAALGLPKRCSSYRKAKHLLKLDLLNAASAIKPNDRERDNRKRSYAYVWKLIAIAKQLRTSTDSEVLLSYLEEAYERASKDEMLDAAYQAATMLRRQYNNRRFDAERYALYRDRAAYYGELTQAYQKVVADLNEITYLRNSRANTDTIRAQASAYFEANAPLIERYDVAAISYIVFLTELNARLADQDYAGVIEVAQRALNYLLEKPTVQPAMFQVFEANLTVAYTQLNDYENGMTFARRLLANTSPEEYNYLKVYELMLVLTLRASKFQEAYEIYQEIPHGILTTDMRAFYHESFRIMEAYLFLLVSMGRIEPRADDRRFERFRVARFVNSFRHVNGEKNHRNVHLLVIQIVDDLIHRRHGKSAFTIEAITKYASRHLKGKGFERVRYFLKALSQLSVQGFHRAAVERHTDRYLKAMRKFAVAEGGHAFHLELIPFDVLWGLIVEQLGYKRLRSSKRR